MWGLAVQGLEVDLGYSQDVVTLFPDQFVDPDEARLAVRLCKLLGSGDSHHGR